MLPLPPPPEHDDAPPTRTGRRSARQVPNANDYTGELPRLPEVNMHDDSSLVRVDPRALSPKKQMLSEARQMPTAPPPVPRAARPTHPEKPQPNRQKFIPTQTNTPPAL
jgi:hypothetical protein